MDVSGGKKSSNDIIINETMSDDEVLCTPEVLVSPLLWNSFLTKFGEVADDEV